MTPAKHKHRANHTYSDPMATPLHLTADEKEIFDGLSNALKEGWVVEKETGRFEDSPKQMQMRQQVVRIHNPVLRTLKDNASGKSSEEIIEALQGMDMEEFEDDDISQLYFVLGPAMLSRWIAVLLAEVKTDEDLEALASLSGVRHLLMSTQPSAA